MGAISKKDFGVAFGGAGTPEPSETCYTLTANEARITSVTQLQGLSVLADTDIVEKNITKISFYIRKNGTPTGTVNVRAWDDKDDIPDSPAASFGTFDADTDLTTSFQKKTFDITEGEYTVLVGSQIGLDWGSGSHSSDIYLQGDFADNTNGSWFIDSYTQVYELISSGAACPHYCWFGS